jgi:hypothetical protein
MVLLLGQPIMNAAVISALSGGVDVVFLLTYHNETG